MVKSLLRAADLIGLLLIMVGLLIRLSPKPGWDKYAWLPMALGAALVVVGVAAKYVLFGRGNFFLEPVSLEFYPVQSSIDTDFGTYEADSQIFYNVMFAGGVNF